MQPVTQELNVCFRFMLINEKFKTPLFCGRGGLRMLVKHQSVKNTLLSLLMPRALCGFSPSWPAVRRQHFRPAGLAKP